MSRTRWSIRIAVGIVAGMLAIGTSAAASFAAEETIGIELPPSATSVWIDLEQAGLRADAVVVSVLSGAHPVTVPMTTTTFGVHGQVPAAGSRLSLSVRSAAGAPPAAPDLSVTVLDAHDRVLAGADARIILEPGRHAVVDPDSEAQGTTSPSPSSPSRSGPLALTGPGEIALALALALLVGGALLLIGRRALRARGEVAR